MVQKKTVQVAVGVVLRQTAVHTAQQRYQVYLTQRSIAAHQGGKWEFPGGKCEPGETVLQALQRELKEEIGIVVNDADFLMDIRHDYGDKNVLLDVYTLTNFSGEPFGKEGQVGAWFELTELTNIDFPAANTAIVQRIIEQY